MKYTKNKKIRNTAALRVLMHYIGFEKDTFLLKTVQRGYVHYKYVRDAANIYTLQRIGPSIYLHYIYQGKLIKAKLGETISEKTVEFFYPTLIAILNKIKNNFTNPEWVKEYIGNLPEDEEVASYDKLMNLALRD